MKKLLTIKTKRLKKAIDLYFETKFKNNGYFLNSQEKDKICNDIILYAKKENKGCEIVPGCIILKTKTKHIVKSEGRFILYPNAFKANYERKINF